MQVNLLQSNRTFGARYLGMDKDGVRKSEIIINNPKGIHARPATEIIKLLKLNENEGDVFISRTEGERNPIRDSLLSLLMLALSQGTIVFLETEPSYSEDFHNAIARCFEAPDDDAHAQVALEFQENYIK